MEKLNLDLCKYSDRISLDAIGDFDDSCNGKHGYRVFYSVPQSEIDKLGVFNDLDDLDEDEQYAGGELEFSVDENGEQYGEVLLWCSIENCDEDIFNVEFVNYEHDISQLVDDFNQQIDK